MKVLVARPPVEDNVCTGISRSIAAIERVAAERGRVHAFEPAHEMALRSSGEKLLAGVSALEASLEDVQAHHPDLERVEMVATLDEIDDGFMVVGPRGIPPSVLEEAGRRGIEVLNRTCPFVMSQEHHCQSLVDEGYDVVYCGDGLQHGVPRLQDIVERAGRRFFVADHPEDVEAVPRLRRVGVMAQTTQSLENLRGVVAGLLGRCHEVKVVNSICGDAIPRQAAAREVAAQVDAMVVVGESWGAARVAEVCGGVNARVYRAQTPADLRPEWFGGVRTVGLAPGNAVPPFMITRFVAALERMSPPGGPA